ncbi:MAG: AmmeMemoRadiSam system protein A [Dehalococcoidia bacterium]|nr:AmmeMemoRadiSam system protein A [Dehalococcoidia bacterium]
MSSPLVQLAKDTIAAYVTEGKTLASPTELTPEMIPRAGVFVSIHKGKDLRGCIGTIEPHKASVAEEIIANAISAATRDPRFDPITSDELQDLNVSIDVLSAPELVAGVDKLDPKKYGLIVECGYRRGLLLPDLPGVESAQEQVDICRAKGGIRPNEHIKLYRFEVKRYQ